MYSNIWVWQENREQFWNGFLAHCYQEYCWNEVCYKVHLSTLFPKRNATFHGALKKCNFPWCISFETECTEFPLLRSGSTAGSRGVGQLLDTSNKVDRLLIVYLLFLDCKHSNEEKQSLRKSVPKTEAYPFWSSCIRYALQFYTNICNESVQNNKVDRLLIVYLLFLDCKHSNEEKQSLRKSVPKTEAYPFWSSCIRYALQFYTNICNESVQNNM